MIPRNYGDPAAEYDAIRNGAAVIVRNDRAILRMHGRDPMRIIQGIVTNDVANAPADRAIYAAMLTAKGRMLADVRIMRIAAQELLLDVPASALADLLEVFRKTIPPLFARFEDVTHRYTLIGVYGPRARHTLHMTKVDVPALPARDGFAEREWEVSRIFLLTTQDTGSDGYEILTATEAARSFENALVSAGGVRAGSATLDVARIEGGTPRWDHELGNETIPLEADLQERAISTSKGCYTGQEVIIRVLHRGHVNWHLRGFLFGDAVTPAPGTTLKAGGTEKSVARITSAAFSPLYNQTIALGYGRREIVTPAELVTSEGTPVRMVALPFDVTSSRTEET